MSSIHGHTNLGDFNLRERYLRTMHYQKVDRIPNFEFGYWDTTLPRWHEQGLPREIDNEAKAYAYFGIENWRTAPVHVGLLPGFPQKVLEETDDYIIAIDGNKSTYQVQKTGERTIPHYIDYGLKTRKDWEEFKERLDPDTPGRYPENWDEIARRFNTNRDYPLAIGIGSMIGVPRNWIGFENLAYMCYDDPDLLEDIVNTLGDLVVKTIERALQDVRFDFAAGWEDICFNSGPIISPKFFDMWIVPNYKRITDLLKQHGVDIALTDCDGNVVPICPQFLEGGINCMFPVEVNAGSDPVAMREKFGKELLLQGGVDKMKLKGSFQDIEKELLRLKPVVDEGGFIPHVDHRVPSDVPLRNYKFYLKLKREIFNAGKLEPHYDESKI